MAQAQQAMGVDERIAAHPLVVALREEMEAQLEEYPAGPHSHPRSIPNGWFRRWVLRQADYRVVDVPCAGELSAERWPARFRAEWDWQAIGWRLVLSRQWRCLTPSVPDSAGLLLRYVARRVTSRALHEYRG